ncbi:PEP-CTERM sorting domain-containing protein [Colwellia sp. UCD-KL20]|uniref:PEP-CTERM sorting domain-containing protein n=1 Tax=Colwellia sp. UCD-KL20 TaxID=1917165 RepID=UPI000970C088|nr:PEP-CTERM sorting domain-containing protein [Colwellia sp. UCD-KL20]
MKTLLTAGALLLASSQAFAGMVTETASFGTQGDLTNQPIGFGINETVTINAFNTALGSLTGVSINVYSQIDTAGKSTNTSGLNGASQFKFNLDSDWTVSSAVGNYTFNGAGNIFTETDTDHQINEVFDYGHLDIFKTGAFTSTDFSAFTSDVNFNFVINATSSFNNIANGGSALFTNQIDSSAWGKVEVTYTYDDVSTSVPETGSLAIFGLGLAGFALSRKAKKSA